MTLPMIGRPVKNSAAKAFLLCLVLLRLMGVAQAQKTVMPRVFTWLPDKIATVRQRTLHGDAALAPALRKLREDAEKAAAQPLVAVTDKPANLVASSGDPHDYVSVSVYFWPDPNDPKAPWISHDGKRNDDAVAKTDSQRLSQMQRRVTTCTEAWYFTGDARFAKSAAEQLRHWFLDPATKMNPHLDYAQSVPNKSKGEPWGIIDANGFPDLLNSVGLLAESPYWTAKDQAGLQAWFKSYGDWLWNSDLGHRERAAKNNHGTFYDVQVAAAALFVGDRKRAHDVLDAVGPERIAHQIESDGSTPHEQARPFAGMYTSWNLKGFSDLMVLGRSLGIDLWKYETSDKRSLRRAALWLAPFVENPASWKFGDGKFTSGSPTEFFWIIASTTGDEEITRIFHRYMTPTDSEKWRESRLNLLYPLP